MSNSRAEFLKNQGNIYFKAGEYDAAAKQYSLAINLDPQNPLYYSNRANARKKLRQWQAVVEDCLVSTALAKNNFKTFYSLSQAQLELDLPNEALVSASTAYELASRPADRTVLVGFVLRCKIAKWNLRELERLKRASSLFKELIGLLEQQREHEIKEITASVTSAVGLQEELDSIKSTYDQKINDLKTVFAIADPCNIDKREIPDYLVDAITFEIMHDPVVTNNGDSYDLATISEHLKRNPTDPITRLPLSIQDLRPNIALRKACDEFWENSKGWAVDF